MEYRTPMRVREEHLFESDPLAAKCRSRPCEHAHSHLALGYANLDAAPFAVQ